MKWLPNDDTFIFTFDMRSDLKPILEHGYVPTKREVLKVVMSLFDPLGLLSFFLVHGKVLIQDIWAAGITWDEIIGEQLYVRWQQWINLFPELCNLRIPRCYFRESLPKELKTLELHVFVDASGSAYACAAYFRLETGNQVQVALVIAKTKVTPIKTLSIPRLELKAAVLGVHLVEAIQNHHKLHITRKILWSDSTTVLAWIRSDHRRYRKFVAIRIGEILTASSPEEWRWVPSEMNVADKATKWHNGPNFNQNNPWFCGPTFLKKPETHWPKPPQSFTTKEELRPNQVHWLSVPLVDTTRFSKWTTLHRMMAYVFRFKINLRRKQCSQNTETGPLNQDELKKAEESLWRMAQREAFHDEIKVLRLTQGSAEARHGIVKKSSSIYKACPYMDNQGILRVRGRIAACPFASFEAKFPCILPRNHRITQLIVDWYHRRYRHANRETVVNELRQRFDIAKLRALVEKIEKQCLICRIKKASCRAPLMAALPLARLQAYIKPFTAVSLDYFGPILVKVGRSQVKRWVALFTCLSINGRP
ncbi:uncharacterized protein LOC134206860 [Armigeres subalbatus]|uniref:uncharacterized protein LOC134206860 n=1 Tax=Armigeres subalbatus TaxID=124917 RepID=UPI002ED08365